MKKITGISVISIIALIGIFLAYKRFVNTNLSSTTTSVQNKIYNSPEYGFSVNIPTGWSYSTSQERALTTVLVVELKSNDKKISVPIFVDQKNWDIVKAEVSRNFKSDATEETTFSNQPAIKVVSREKEINPGYTFRIKHPNRELVLLGTALCVRCSDVASFHQEVEQILSSLKFD